MTDMMKKLQQLGIVPVVVLNNAEDALPLAERLVAAIQRISGVTPLCGSLDIAMFRDDIGLRKTLPQIF